jgi:hypothetical protein
VTKTESVLQAFVALLATAPGLPPVARSAVTFSRVQPFTVTPAGGDPITADVGFVLFDGTGRIDDARSTVGDYEIEHTADLEILVQGEHCDAVFDAILAAVGDLTAAHRTGEDWDFLELGVPARDFAPDETHDQGKGCVLPVIFTYRSTQPF